MHAAAVVSVAMGLAGLTAAAHLATAPDPFSPSAALVIATGIVVFLVIAVTGLLLPRGRWARILNLALSALILALGAITPPTVWSWISIAAALFALGGLSGRWLSGWIRPRPSATGPGPEAISLILGLIALVPLVGFAAPNGLESAHGIVGAAGVLLAWAYAKAQPWSIWGLRLVLPLVAIPPFFVGPVAGAVAIAVWIVALTAIAWTAPARLATIPVFDRPPGARHGTAKLARGEE